MKLGVDPRLGPVAIVDDKLFPLHGTADIPEGHPDPLLWLIQSGASSRDVSVGPAAVAPLEIGRLLPPISRPPKVIAAPVNYLDHKAEMNEQKTIADYGVFLKAPTSVIGPSGSIRLPYTDMRIDQEGELGVVIGAGGAGIRREDALNHVFGYTCLLDISVRSSEDRSTRKSFNTFTPIGPWITTADEIPDPGALGLQCWVNDQKRQDASTTDLIYDVPLLIEYASSIMTLEPGDIIATGTPAGVGPLEDRDVVRLRIDRVGELSVTVTSSHATRYATRPAR